MSVTMKAVRMNLRIDAERDERIRLAAQTSGVSVSAFVADAAATAADRVLADRREFKLDRASWDRFVELLDSPARELPRLREAAALHERLLDE